MINEAPDDRDTGKDLFRILSYVSGFMEEDVESSALRFLS